MSFDKINIQKESAMKRVLVGSMHHESNSFNPIITYEKDFSLIYGEDSLCF